MYLVIIDYQQKEKHSYFSNVVFVVDSKITQDFYLSYCFS